MIKIIFLLLVFTQVLFSEAEREEFLFAISGEPDTLDPQATSGTLTFQIVRSIYDTLLEPGPEGNLIPALAESWNFSEDRLRLTFSLRKKVQFHHGRDFTAGDVVATLKRLQDPDRMSPHQLNYGAIKSVVAEDDYTVYLELTEPSGSLLSTLASGWSAILPADLIKSNHNFATSPVGTGPFRFVSWEPDRRIALIRNDDYWQEGKPIIPAVEFAILTDPALQTQALLAGEIDGIDILSEPAISTVHRNPDTFVYATISGLVLVIAVNTRIPILADKEFREAISASLNRQEVLNIAYGGGEEINTFMDPLSPYYVELPAVSRDSEWIKEVFSRLAPSKNLVITVPSNYTPHVQAAQMYQEMLRKMGLTVDIKLVDWSRWLSEVYRGFDYELTVIGHTGDLDPDRRLSAFGKGESYVGWENEKFVALLNEARVLSDVKKRIPLYQKALRLMGEELPFIYIGVPRRHIGLRKGVKNFSMNVLLDTYDFRDLSLQ